MAKNIKKRSDDYAQWYLDVIKAAKLADYAPVKGCMVIRPEGFAIWEAIQRDLDRRFKATGHVKTNETLGIEVMRMLQLAAHRAQVGTPAVTAVQVTVHADVASYLLNKKRRDIAAMEDRAKMEVVINGVPGVSPDTLEFKCYDSNGNEVRLLSAGPPPRMFGGGRPQGRYAERRYPVPLD